jgi:hypothetical protein
MIQPAKANRGLTRQPAHSNSAIGSASCNLPRTKSTLPGFTDTYACCRLPPSPRPCGSNPTSAGHVRIGPCPVVRAHQPSPLGPSRRAWPPPPAQAHATLVKGTRCRRGLTQRHEGVTDGDARRSVGGSASRRRRRRHTTTDQRPYRAGIDALFSSQSKRLGSSTDPGGRHMTPACCDADPAVHV